MAYCRCLNLRIPGPHEVGCPLWTPPAPRAGEGVLIPWAEIAAKTLKEYGHLAEAHHVLSQSNDLTAARTALAEIAGALENMARLYHDFSATHKGEIENCHVKLCQVTRHLLTTHAAAIRGAK